jgi:hypothetical protein
VNVALLLVASLVFALPVLEHDSKLDPALESRAKEYFRSLAAGDFDNVWELSSTHLRDASGNDREAFIARLQELAPYDMKVELLVGWSAGDEGRIYLRIHTRNTKADSWSATDYEARWIQEADRWFLDDLSESTCFERALHEWPRISSSPN